jgi:hypothetical protein
MVGMVWMISVVVVLAACSGDRTMHPRPRPASTQQPMAQLRATLERAKIRVETRNAVKEVRSRSCDDPTLPCLRCDVASATDVAYTKRFATLARTFARYPTHVLEAAQIERVTLCTTLEEVGLQSRLVGVADLEARRLLVNLVGFIWEADDPEDQTVHHELFHLLDWALRPATYEDDPEWSKLNVADFAYGTNFETEQQGFVTGYAKTNVIEDRACVFQYLMVQPDATCARAERDPILAAKIALLIQRLADRIDITFLTDRARCTDLSRRPRT